MVPQSMLVLFSRRHNRRCRMFADIELFAAPPNEPRLAHAARTGPACNAGRWHSQLLRPKTGTCPSTEPYILRPRTIRQRKNVARDLDLPTRHRRRAYADDSHNTSLWWTRRICQTWSWGLGIPICNHAAYQMLRTSACACRPVIGLRTPMDRRIEG
jgi:hypothetical protein